MKFIARLICFVTILLCKSTFVVSEVSADSYTDLESYFGGSSYVTEQPRSLVFRKKKRKKKVKNTIGTYSGTFVLKKSRSFNGATCTPTQSFPAVFSVTGTKKRPSGQLGNIPIEYSGRANKKGARLSGTYTESNINRKYVMLLRKVKSTSAKLTMTETVKVSGIKACVFKHTAVFSRS